MMKNLFCVNILFATGLLLCMVSPASGQVGVEAYSLSSPNAAALGAYGGIPISHYTGSASMTVPITTVADRQLELPISLTYNGSGNRVEDTASWVGLGWSLSAGGVITRSVRALPDDSQNGYLSSGSNLWNSTYWNNPSHSTLVAGIENGTIDPEPDMFYYSTPFESGRFVVHPQVLPDFESLGASPINSSDVKILFSRTLGPVGNTPRHIESFTLIDEGGTKYTFDALEWTEDLDETTNSVIRQYVSSWYLTEIEDASSDNKISFTYALESSSYYTRGLQRTVLESGNAFPCFDGELSINHKHTIDELRLTTIATSSDTLLFQDAARLDDRNVLTNQFNGKRLDYLTHRRNGSILRRVSFYYSYFLEDLTTLSGDEPTYYEPKRLRLDSVRTVGIDLATHLAPYKFSYTAAPLPSQFTFDIDHWGYYNGKNNTTIFPTVDDYNNHVYQGADRNGDVAFAIAGMLTRMDYPTGGHTVFDYEAHDFDGNSPQFDPVAGGVRLKKTTTSDGGNNPVIIRNLDYSSGGTSSGVLLSLPDYIYYPTQSCDPNADPDVVVVSRPLRSLGGSAWIGYHTVTEYAGNGDSGESVFEYTSAIDFPNTDYPPDSSGAFGRSTSLALRRGRLLATTYSNDTGIDIAKEQHTIASSAYKSLRAISYSGSGYVSVPFKYYVHRAHVFREKSDSFVYDSNGNNAAVTTTETAYDVTGRGHHQPISVTLTNTDTEKLITEYSYAHESHNGMANLNMKSQLDSVWVRQEGLGKTTLRAQRQGWTVWPDQKWRPDTLFAWDGEYLAGEPDELNYPLIARATNKILAYDLHGNVLVSAGSADHFGNSVETSTIWNAQGNTPIATVVNAIEAEVSFDHFNSDSSFVDELTITSIVDGSLHIANETSNAWISIFHNVPSLDEFVLETDILINDEFSDTEIAINKTGGIELIRFGVSSAGEFVAFDNGTKQILPISYELGRSYHLRVIASPNEDEWSLYVDGTFAGSFGASAPGNSRELRIWEHNGDGSTVIDNVRFYPNDAIVSSVVYNETTLLAEEVVDPNGAVTKFGWDPLLRSVSSRDIDNNIITTVEYSLSADRNGSYSPADPNFVRNRSFATPAAGSTLSESFDSLPSWDSYDLSNGISVTGSTWTVSGGELVHQYGSNATNWNGDLFVWDLGTELDGTFTVEISLTPDASSNGYSFGIAAGGDAWTPNVGASTAELALWSAFDGNGDKWRSYGSGGWVIVESGFQSATTYVLRMDFDTQNQEIDFYVDGVLKIAGRPFRSPVQGGISQLAFFNLGKNTSTNTEWRVQDLTIQASGGPVQTEVVATQYIDGLGRPIQSHFGSGSPVVSAQFFDEFGRVDTLVRSFGATATTFVSDPITSATSAMNGRTGSGSPYSTLEYDPIPFSRLDEVSRVGKPTTTVTYDATTEILNGHRVAVRKTVDEDNNETKTYTDGRGRVLRISKLNGAHSTHFEYDNLGQLTKITSPEGRISEFAYDAVGRLVGVNTPDSDGSQDGNPTNETIASQLFDYETVYDDRNRVRFTRDPNSGTEESGYFIYNIYDDFDRLIETGAFARGNPDPPVDFDDARSSSEAANNPSWMSSFNVPLLTFEYEGARLTKSETEHNDFVEYEYDKYGRLSAETVSLAGLTGSKRIEYDYDLQDRLIATRYQAGETDSLFHWFEYDDNGRLSRVSSIRAGESSENLDAEYTYNSVGELSAISLGDNAETVDYTYDIEGRLTAINDPELLGQDVFGQRLGYENQEEIAAALNAPTRANGNITWSMWATEGLTTPDDVVGYAYEYDELSRLTVADFATKAGTSWTNRVEYDVGTSNPISYDDDGNIEDLLRRDEDNAIGDDVAISYTYANSGSNRLSSVNGGHSDTFGYDFNGNMTSRAGQTTVYDFRNLPVAVTSGSSTWEYRYDANGYRVFKGDGTNATAEYYVRDSSGSTLAVYDGNGNLRYWNLGIGGEIGRAFPQ